MSYYLVVGTGSALSSAMQVMKCKMQIIETLDIIKGSFQQEMYILFYLQQLKQRMGESENNPEVQQTKQKGQDSGQLNSESKENRNDEQQMNYYNQFCRLYLTNTILTAQLKQLNVEKNELISKLSRIQKRAEELSEGNSGQADEKKRRVRRSASEIARHYKCQVQGCNKSYGSEGSLNQHLKIKHPDIFRTLGAFALANNPPVKESEDEDESL